VATDTFGFSWRNEQPCEFPPVRLVEQDCRDYGGADCSGGRGAWVDVAAGADIHSDDAADDDRDGQDKQR
jgi:hypothetical protein